MSEPAATSLGARILRETARFAAIQTVASVLAWVANIALARMLSPSDFGVYDICVFYIGFGSLLGDGGLGAALLRRKGDVSTEEYRVALTSLLVLASLLGSAMFVAAPFIGRHARMNGNEITVLRAMAPMYLVSALRIVPYIRMERELRFSQIARIELTCSLVRHVLAVSVASAHGGVWALAASNMVAAVLQLVLAYRASPGWPGLGFSWQVLKPLVSFGGQVQALGICAYLKDRISPALLGNRLGKTAVGVFDFGMAYIQWPVIAVNGLARVQLPVYSRLESDDPLLFGALRGAIRTATLVGLPVLCASALAAPWLIPLLFGARWAPCYPVVWGLLFNMIGGLSASPLFTLLQGQGRPRLAIGIFVAWTTSTWALTVAAVLWRPGDLGLVALAHSVVTVLVVTGLISWARRHLRRGLFRSLRGPVVAGLVSLASGTALERLAHGPAAHPLFAALVAVVAYAGVLLLLEGRLVVDELRALARSIRPKSGEPVAG